MTQPPTLAARLVDVEKCYRAGKQQVQAIRRSSVDIPAGAFWMVTGPSGCGKSTLLNLLGCVDAPETGVVEVGGVSMRSLSERKVTRFRREHIGFVFQGFNLVPVLDARENVEYPLRLLGVGRRERARRALAALEEVGLGAEHAARRPGELSGGQQQRVAIARALVKRPKLVLADEPTANLDSGTGAEVVALMRRMQRSLGTTFVFSTHDTALLEQADVVARMKDGRFLAS